MNKNLTAAQEHAAQVDALLHCFDEAFVDRGPLTMEELGHFYNTVFVIRDLVGKVREDLDAMEKVEAGV